MNPSLAYFIMVHHKPLQFEWLMRALDDPDDLKLVHVDLKSRLGIKANRRGLYVAVRQICNANQNVRLLASRFTNWGGWSLSQVLLDAIGTSLRADPDWTHFINLSGQCYPIKSMATIKQRLAGAPNAIYIERLPIAETSQDDWHRSAPAMFETPLRAIKLARPASPPRGFSLDYKGSQWAILPRRFCQWIVDSPAVPPITRYLRRRLLSDELILQALVENSPYMDDLAGHNAREIVWPGPKIYKASDLSNLLASDRLFGRKFDLDIDGQVLAGLARAGDYPAGQAHT